MARLIDEEPYTDGNAGVATSYRSPNGGDETAEMTLEWKDLQEDYEQCLNTYQSPVITEYAALAIACILCERKARLEITEVTRRGDKVDYWLGDRELLLEVSGTKEGDLDKVCEAKVTKQLQKNPFMKDGYVCVSRFGDPEARLWFYAYKGDKPDRKKSK